MYVPLLLGLFAFVASLVLTPTFRELFNRLKVVDRPDNVRKLHSRPIPRVGGIPIAIAYLLAFGLLFLFPGQTELLGEHNAIARKLLPAAGIIFLTGILDDLVGLKPWQKLLGQVSAAVWVYWLGVRISLIAYHQPAEWWSLPLTLIWLIACTNAFNLIDGLDGLAAGIGFLTTITIVLASILNHNHSLATATVPLAGAILGFLCYNFNPASIFLGDSGSLLIGFLLGCYAIIWSQKSVTILGMTAPLMAFAVPMADVALAVVRRYLRRQPIFSGDRGHIHHRLLARGLTPRAVALVLYGVCGIAAACSLIESFSWYGAGGLVIVLFCFLLWVGILHLGYVEFNVFRLMVVGGEFRRLVSAQIGLRGFEQSLLAARTAEECWEAIRTAARDFGFSWVEVNLAGYTFEEEFSPASPADTWDLRLVVSNSEYVHLRRDFRSSTQPMLLAPFVELLQTRLRTKRLDVGTNMRRSHNLDLNARSTANGTR